MDIVKEVLEAEQRIKSLIRETPVEHSLYLSRLAGCEVFLKLENLQITGSFKLRGAANKLLSLSKQEIEKGVVTASSGNHGAAFAYLLGKFGWSGTIYLPEYTSPVKVESLRLLGADIEFYGSDCLETEGYAKAMADKNNRTYVPPYNDPKVIGGQGTVGRELENQVENLNALLVPVGGGGLASGAGGYLKTLNSKIEVIGCLPANSPIMYESVKAGRIVEMESLPTLSDGSAGGIEQGSITFDICQEIIDLFVLVSEDEIKEALKLVLEKHNILIEGSATLPVAALIKEKDRFAGRRIALVLTGSKISLEKLKEVLN